MKKSIVMAIAILFSAGITAFASQKNDGTNPGKRINYHLSFTKIELSDDIDLVLKESSDKTIDVTGTATHIDNVDWKIKEGILFIKSKKGSLKDKVHVTVTVSKLQRLDINGQSVVSSHGTLNSESLHVIIEGDSYVSLSSSGEIYITNSHNTELDVRRKVGDVIVSR